MNQTELPLERDLSSTFETPFSKFILDNLRLRSIMFDSIKSSEYDDKMKDFVWAVNRISAKFGVPVDTIYKQTFNLFSKERILPWEYFNMGIYKHSELKQREFIGYLKSLDIWKKYNKNKQELTILSNKWLTESVLKGSINHNNVTNTFYAGPTNTFDFPKSKLQKPFFCKPSASFGGNGAFLVSKLENEALHLHDGSTLTWEEFVDKTSHHKSYLFQEVLFNHQDFIKLSPESMGLNTIRVLMLEQNIIWTTLKVSRGSNIVDNFAAKGNVSSGVNVDSGIVDNPFYASDDYLCENPITLQTRVFQVPLWNMVKDLAIRVSRVFSKTGILGLDIAITDNNAVIVDVNPNPGLMIMQFSHQKGIKPYLAVNKYKLQKGK